MFKAREYAFLFSTVTLLSFQVAVPVNAQGSNPYFTVNITKLPDGAELQEGIINGPSKPPPGYEFERQVVSLPKPDIAAGTNTLTQVPAFNWVFGCSAVSGAMMPGYYQPG